MAMTDSRLTSERAGGARAGRKAATVVVATVLISLALSGPAFAYVDPGSGSLVLQTIVAVLAGGMAVFKGWRYRIVEFVRRITGRKSSGGQNPPEQ